MRSTYISNTWLKACLQYRESFKNDFAKKIPNLRASLLATLAKASETNSDTQINDVLCGQGFHTSTTEFFFPKLTYSAEAFDSERKLLVPSCTSGYNLLEMLTHFVLYTYKK